MQKPQVGGSRQVWLELGEQWRGLEGEVRKTARTQYTEFDFAPSEIEF